MTGEWCNFINLFQRLIRADQFISGMDLLENWGIEAVKKRDDINFYGSPERCLKRELYEDKNGNVYILESILDVEKKRRIAEALDEIHHGLPVSRYLKSINGEYVVDYGLRSYLVSKYVFGEELARPGFVNDKWRGRALAEFLIELRNKKPSSELKGVSLAEYIKDFCNKMNMEDYYQFLSMFFRANLKRDFCHGDLHPLNVVWGKDKINAVIDWEFCGENYRGYDAANLLGCLGIEHPDYLFSPLAIEFMTTLIRAEYFNENELGFLLELILAIRFGWLAEWLRKNDSEMIELEKNYMAFLKNNHQKIRSRFFRLG